MIHSESFDGSVPLRAAYAVFFKQFIRDAADLEAVISALGIATRLNCITQAIYFPCQRIPVNFRQICASPYFIVVPMSAWRINFCCTPIGALVSSRRER